MHLVPNLIRGKITAFSIYIAGHLETGVGGREIRGKFLFKYLLIKLTIK